MFWAWTFGSFLFGSWSTTLLSSSVADFEYNWYEFGNDTFRLTNLPDFEWANSILFDTYDTALAHWWWLNWYYIKPKRLTIEGVLTCSSSGELETAIDALKYAILQNQQTLTYTKPNSVVLQATASCTKVDIQRKPYHITFVPVSLEFTVLDPFLYETEVNEATDTANTSNFTGISDRMKLWSIPKDNTDLQFSIVLHNSIIHNELKYNNRIRYIYSGWYYYNR